MPTNATMSGKIGEIAGLVGGADVRRDGTRWDIMVADPADPGHKYFFAIVGEDAVTFDRAVGGEYEDEGRLRVTVDASARAIAAEINRLVRLGQEAYYRS